MQAKSFEGLSIGAGGGYTNSKAFAQEIFWQVHLKMKKRIPLEPKIGFNHYPFRTEFQGKQIECESIGVFSEVTVYPFVKYLFVGARWTVLTVNWSVADRNTFTGSNLYGIAGLNFPIGKIVNIQLYAMPGIQQYRISDGSFSYGSYVFNGTGQEHRAKFIFQANAAIVIRLYTKRYRE
jgi:hypothetical protein